MATKKAVLGGMLAALTLVVTCCIWAGWNHSVAFGVWVQRRGFDTLGLERTVIESRLGPQVAFQPPPGSDGPAVVLIHGFGDQAGTWLGLARQIVEHHRLIVVDLAGHGDSEPVHGALQFDDLYLAFSDLLEEVRATHLVLVGNSLGGWVALRYALDHPDRIERLVLINSAGLTQPLNERWLIPGDRADLTAKMERIFPEGTIPTLPGFVQDQIIARTSAPRFESLFESTLDAHVDQRLSELGAPTHLVWGTPDGFFPIDYARRLQASIPQATLHELPGCGHAPQVVCPRELGDWLLGSLTPSGGSP